MSNTGNTTKRGKIERIIFRYPGGKGRLAPWIVSHFPREIEGVYCEPFVGKGNVFFFAAQVLKCNKWWLNDITQHKFFNALLRVRSDQIPSLVRESEKSVWIARSACGDPLSILLEGYLTFGSMGYDKNKFVGDRLQYPKCSNHTSLSVARNNLIKARRIILQIGPKITGVDYLKVLDQLGEGDFCYLDPPYRGINVKSYNCKQVDHKKIVDKLLVAKYKWVLSEYDVDYYSRYLGSSMSSKKCRMLIRLCDKENLPYNIDTKRVEYLWSNFTLDNRGMSNG